MKTIGVLYSFAAAFCAQAAFATAYTFTPGDPIPLATRSGLNMIAKEYVTVNTLASESFSTQTSDYNMYSRISMVQGSYVAFTVNIPSAGDYELSFQSVGIYTSKYRITTSQESSGFEESYNLDQNNREKNQIFSSATTVTQTLESLPSGEVAIKLEITTSADVNKTHFGNFCLAKIPGAAQYGGVEGALEDIIALAAGNATPAQQAVVTLKAAAESVALAPGVALRTADGVAAPGTVKIYINGEDRTSYYKPLEWVGGELSPELNPAVVRPGIATDGTTSLESGEMTLGVTNVKAGLYYCIVCSDEIGGGFSDKACEAQQASADDEVLALEAELDWSGGPVRFFRILATDVAP